MTATAGKRVGNVRSAFVIAMTIGLAIAFAALRAAKKQLLPKGNLVPSVVVRRLRLCGTGRQKKDWDGERSMNS